MDVILGLAAEAAVDIALLIGFELYGAPVGSETLGALIGALEAGEMSLVSKSSLAVEF